MDKTLDLDSIIESADVNTVVEEVLKSGDFDATKEVKSALPYLKKVGINEIVSIEYQEKLMAIDDTISNCYFLIGDITNDIIHSVNRQRAKELGKVVSQTDIFEAVGFFTHRTARSIRYYWVTASFFPPEVREKYDVPFNVYAVARWTKDWELLLQLASENPQLSAEAVRNLYYKTIGEEPPVREKGSAPEGAEVELPEATEPNGKYKAVLLSQLDHVTDSIRAVLDRIPLPTSVRARIGEVLLEIADIVIEIRREA